MNIKKLRKDRTTRKGMIVKLDRLFSKLIIERDKKCVQCGSDSQLTCGHVFSRKHYSTRWDFLNCHCQCWPCNYRHVHDTYPYTEWFRKNYGTAAYNRLYKKWNEITDLKLSDLQEIYVAMQRKEYPIIWSHATSPENIV